MEGCDYILLYVDMHVKGHGWNFMVMREICALGFGYINRGRKACREHNKLTRLIQLYCGFQSPKLGLYWHHGYAEYCVQYI